MKIEIYPILVVLMLLTAGCVWATSEAPSGAKIKFEGSFYTVDGFSMNGQIMNIAKDPPTFENVAVYLYDDNKTLMGSSRVGTLEHESSRFSIQSEAPPEYIIMYSDQFWTAEEVDINYYTRIYSESDDSILYNPYPATTKDDLPVVPNTVYDNKIEGYDAFDVYGTSQAWTRPEHRRSRRHRAASRWGSVFWGC